VSEDFNWNSGDDSESVILPHQPRTAVYSTKGGGICIRQEADAYEEYDPQLLLTPQGALAVAWALIEEANLVGLPEPSLSLMTESANWPPPTRRPALDPDPAQRPVPAANDEPGPLLRAMQAST
jgi:hypothetical protein